MVQFKIDVVVDPRLAKTGTDRVVKQFDRIDRRASRTAAVVKSSFGRAFAGFAGVAAVVGAVRSIAKFEEAIATAGAVSKATAAEFQLLTDRALNLGITTRFSATQAADALTGLTRAGFSVSEAIESVDDTLKLAQAGGLGLAEATDIAASTLRGFRLEVDQASRVTDVLVAAANNANTNVQQMGEGMKFVAPIAAGLNVSLEASAAAMGILSDAGLKASLAGTGLRRVLAELESPGAGLVSALESAGKSANDIRPSLVGLERALEVLRGTGIDTGEALEFFGQRGGPAFEVLVNQIPKLVTFTEKMKQSGGEAERVAKIMDDTLSGALFRAGSAINGVVQAFGQAGTSGALVTALDSMSVAIRAVAANADTLLSTLLQFGALFAAIKLGPFVSGMAASAKATLSFNAAVASGNATLLSSTAAQAGRAAATVAGIEADIAATAASIASLNARHTNTLGLVGNRKAIEARAIAMQQVAVLEAKQIGLTNALTAAQAKNTAAIAANSSTTFAAQFAMGGMRKATIAAAGAMVSFNATLAVAAVALFGVNKLLEFQKGLLDDIDDAFDSVESNSKGVSDLSGQFRLLSGQIREAEKAIRISADQYDRIATPEQLARLSFWVEKRKVLLESIKKEIADTRAVADAKARNNVSIENTIARLDREAAALINVTKESKARAEAEKEIQTLLQAGIVPTAADKQGIEDRIKRNKSLEVQKALLESIQGPQKQFAANEAALSGLLQRNAITAEEFKNKLAELKAELTGDSIETSFENSLDSLIKQNDELENLLTKGKLHADALNLENQLRLEGETITRAVQDNIAEELLRQKSINDSLTRKNELIAEGKRLREDEERRAKRQQQDVENVAGRINDQKRLLEGVNLVEAARQQGLVTTEQAGEAFDRLTLRALEGSKQFEDGFSRAFLKIKFEAEDLAAVGEAVVGVFADRATEALTTFAETGKLNFKDLATSILGDLTKIITRLLIVQALNAAFGGGTTNAATATTSISGSFEHGGTTQPGSSYVVGENGPEIFTPDRTGAVAPNAASVAQEAPQVNVQVVNVGSEDDIPQAISNGGSDDAIVNVLQRNKDKIKQIIS